ncbi:ATP-binding protein [Ectothiorhodospira shaposhnikovii]|uniref:GAF domain-containing hybrid sensor histidine kinase/response regulator n=1 Tax=Ectothiorhodospira shaposhnikovii TaxID=1054 RepID=UPI0039A3DDFD
MNLVVETQVLLQISLSVGRSLELDSMLGICLATLVRSTNSLGAAVLRQDREGPRQSRWPVMRCMPMRLSADAAFADFLREQRCDQLWAMLEARRGSGFLILEHERGSVHVFQLPGYGLLITFSSEPLPVSFCESFCAVADKLAQACLACKQSEELEKWGEFERLLTHFSMRFMTAQEHELDPLINAGLEQIGSLVRADRAFLFSYDLNAYTATNTHEWCAPGISSELANLQQFPLQGLEAWVEAHRAGEVHYVPDVPALPPESSLRHALEPQGIRSNITIPIMGKDGHCEGFVGFDAVHQHRQWGSIDVAILRTMADMFANAEIRRRQQREIRRVQEALIQSRDEANQLAMKAKAANEAKSRFLATVSHEIRTPITAMLGMAELLLDSPLDAKQRRHALSLVRSGEALRSIINDILDFSEIESEQVRINHEVVDLYRVLRDSLHILETAARKRDNVVVVDLAPDLPEAVLVDVLRMRQILWNLVGNAIKFTQNGFITLRVRRDPDKAVPSGFHPLVFEVRDTGIGIAPDVIQHLFEPFFQVRDPGSGTIGEGGTGLGLPIVRNLLHAMGGHVEVSSVVGEGTEVRFYLTLEEACLEDRDPSGFFEMFPIVEAGSAGPAQPDKPRKPRILLVEDNADVRELVVETLELLGCEVESACNGREGVDAFLSSDFDLVLMDCQMPVMSGIEATRIIREQERAGRRVPIIALTAALTTEQRDGYLQIGMDDWLPKPYTRKELALILEKWLGEGHA